MRAGGGRASRPPATGEGAAVTALDATLFRAYDIRGEAGRSLTGAAARAIGGAFAAMAGEAAGTACPRIAVGRDGRLSSPQLETALVQGLTAAGADVLRIGLGPTPLLSFAVRRLAADAGVMVTGSHNPPADNGLKLTLGHGPFHGERIQALARRAARPPRAGRRRGGVRVPALDVAAAYVAALLREARAAPPGRAPATVVWDAGNGAAGPLLQRLADGLAGRHRVLFSEVDGRFPNHHPDPTVEENLADLKAAVAAEGADLGIALDGDGDRIGVVDGEGRTLAGDLLLAILAGEVLRRQPGATVIADVKASQVLFDEIARLGGRPLMWRTGHAPIRDKMRETGAPLAGEMSGHLFFADRWFGFDDALYAAVRLLGLLAAGGRSLAALAAALPRAVNTPELRFPCGDERKFEVVEEVRARLAGRGGIVAVDGLRVASAGGWWLLRASNTQPALVARCEAADAEALEKVKDDLAACLAPSGVLPPGM